MIFAAVLVLSLAAQAGDTSPATWGPRDWPDPAPGVSAAAAPTPLRRGLFEAAYRWYRGQSRDNGANCPYYPTCSGYGILAVRERGVPLGIWLTADRLMREYPQMGKFDHYPIVTPHSRARLYDPVPPRRRARGGADD